MQTLAEQTVTPDLKAFLKRFPSATRSSRYEEMARLINSGKYAQAETIALKMETRTEIRAENSVSRSMRIERVAFFTRLAAAEKELKAIFAKFTDSIVPAIEKKANSPKGIPYIAQKVSDAEIVLRRELKSFYNRLLRDSAKLGLKNTVAALTPIFQTSWESADDEHSPFSELMEETKWLEERKPANRFGFQLKKSTANLNDPAVRMTSAKWNKIIQKVMDKNAEAVVGGLKLSERIFSLTKAAQREINRLVADGIAYGKSTEEIARKIKKYTSPTYIIDEEGNKLLPKGAYYSPFKNAYRISRTEANKTYSQMVMAYADEKSWISGVRVHVTQVHEKDDICDDYDGDVFTPDELNAIGFPFHPHCMCRLEPVFDKNKIESPLDTDAEAA